VKISSDQIIIYTYWTCRHRKDPWKRRERRDGILSYTISRYASNISSCNDRQRLPNAVQYDSRKRLRRSTNYVNRLVDKYTV